MRQKRGKVEKRVRCLCVRYGCICHGSCDGLGYRHVGDSCGYGLGDRGVYARNRLHYSQRLIVELGYCCSVVLGLRYRLGGGDIVRGHQRVGYGDGYSGEFVPAVAIVA